MKSPVPTEHAEQAVVIAWWSMYAPLKGVDYRLLFAIPNCAYKSPGQAEKFRKEGLRSGVPDLFLALPRDGKTGNGKAGLFIEMKRQKGRRGGQADPRIEPGCGIVRWQRSAAPIARDRWRRRSGRCWRRR